MTDWKPIDTAPKDGTPILAVSGPGQYAVIVCYKRRKWRPYPADSSWYEDLVWWMPIPVGPNG